MDETSKIWVGRGATISRQESEAKKGERSEERRAKRRKENEAKCREQSEKETKRDVPAFTYSGTSGKCEGTPFT